MDEKTGKFDINQVLEAFVRNHLPFHPIYEVFNDNYKHTSREKKFSLMKLKFVKTEGKGETFGTRSL